MATARLSGFLVLAGLLLPTASSAFTSSGLLEIHTINPTTNAAATLVIGPDGTTVLMDDGKAGDVIPVYLVTQVGMVPLVDHLDYTIALGDGATLTFVAVDGHLVGGTSVTVSGENERSIAVLIDYGDFQYVWASDLTGGSDPDCTARAGVSDVDMETPLAQVIHFGGTHPLLPAEGVDVLQVNHHGSKSSTNAYWMSLLRPEVALISVGPNGYGHPTTVVVDDVLQAGAGCALLDGVPPALVLQTEEGDPPAASTTGYVVGDIRLTTDGNGYDIEATGPVRDGSPDERAAAGLPLTVLVDDQAPGCPMERTLPTGVVTTAETWQAKHRVRSDGSFTVGAGGDVTLQAGTRVELETGFSVGAGGSLRVVIAPVTTCP